MRWNRRGGRSSDVVDARGGGLRPGVAVPGGIGLAGVIVYLLIQVLSGGGGSAPAFGVDDPFSQGVQPPGGTRGIPAGEDPERDLKNFSTYVFSRTLNTWAPIFAASGEPFARAKVVLYRGAVSTGCGGASSAVGPFYCPADQRVYLDLGFYGDMERQLGAPGDFAWAYVIAHEVGHHVQQQLGTGDQVRRLQQERPGEANDLSVRIELQADCYAGVWAHSVYAAGDLEDGDVREATTAAAAVGDDRLQRRATGRVNPDSFTHGSSEQRTEWFNRGRAEGDPADCDTFSPDAV
ncbi:MAG: zinc metallopeptidase [Thermoleophilaceae bacterium]|nr:zinc metallopeptidase [Thermoleophilaceae bacterium]